MGLLEGINLDDPLTQGLLLSGARMMSMGGPSRTPIGLGQVIGDGMTAGLEGYQGAKTNALRQRMAGLQANQMEMQAAEAKRKLDLQNSMTEAAKQFNGPNGFDIDGYINRVTQIDPMQGLALKQQFAKQSEEFNSAPQVGINPATGQPFTYLVGKHGTQKILDNTLPRDKLEEVNLGGKVGFRNPFSTDIVGTVGKSMTPGEQASNALGWANYGISKQRLAMDQSAPRGQYDAERGILVDPRSGVASQVTVNGMPIGAKDKPLTESQGKATNFLGRMKEADATINDLVSKGTKTPSLIKQTAQGVPLVGGALGDAANYLASDDQQKMEQAQRDFVNAVLRQESGASISPQEFDNARKQYFPQPGDSKAVIEQKAKNRKNALLGMSVQAGPGAAKAATPTGPVNWEDLK